MKDLSETCANFWLAAVYELTAAVQCGIWTWAGQRSGVSSLQSHHFILILILVLRVTVQLAVTAHARQHMVGLLLAEESYRQTIVPLHELTDVSTEKLLLL